MSNDVAKTSLKVFSLSSKGQRKKTEEDHRQLDEAMNTIMNEGVNQIEELNSELWAGICYLCDETELTKLRERLNGDDYRPPIIDSELTGDLLSELMIDLYQKANAISTMLEQTEPKFKGALKLYDRAEKQTAGILALQEQWKTEAIFNLTVPIEVTSSLSLAERVVGQLKHRKEAIERSYEIVSRLVTILDSGVKNHRPSRHSQ